VGNRAVAAAKHSAHPVEVQEVGGAIDNRQLWFTPADEQGWVEVTFDVASEQTAELWLRMLHSRDYGTYRVRIRRQRGRHARPAQSPISPPRPIASALRRSARANTRFRFECAGKAKDSQGYYLGFDALVARVPVYTRPPGFDLRKLPK